MHRVKAVSIILTALLLLLIASVAIAQYTPDVLIVDQDLIDGELTVARATSNGPGWIVIYADADGEPGDVIGYAPLMNGINANIMIDLDPDAVTDTLHAVLHEDTGFVGTFEYPDDDAAVLVDDDMVVSSFQMTGIEETVAEVEVATEEDADAVDEEDDEEPAAAEAMATQVTSFVQSFLTLRQDEPAEAEEEVVAEDAAEEEAVAEEDDEAAETEETANAEEVDDVAADAEETDDEATTEEVADEAEATESEEVAESEETSAITGMASQVGAFVQSFLTLDQDAPAEAEEEAIVEEVADEETSDEAVAEEETAEGADEAAETEEAAEAESNEAMTEEIADEAETTETEEVAEAEEPSGISGMASQVGAFVQSFLTLDRDAPAEAEEASAEESAEEEMTDEGDEPMDIVDTAVEAGSFSILASALDTVDLVEALKGEGPFTLFAPTDEAFAALPEGLLDELLQDSDKLAQALLYHVVPDKLMADDIAKIGSALTLEGNMLPFAVDGDNVMVGQADVTDADIEAANGVIHVISQVLLPPAMAEAVAEPVAEEEPEPETPQSIAGSYQESDGASVLLDSVISAGDGWAVIRVDEGFVPGDVLGHMAVPAGESTDVTVDLDAPLTEDTMVWAVLHADDGENGVFEYPDADQPVMYKKAIVMGPFNVAVVDDEEMAAEEEAVEEEVTDAAGDDDAMAEEEVDASGALDMTGVAEAAGAFLQNLLTLSDDDAMAAEGDEEMAAEGDDEEMAAEGDDDAMAAEGDEEMAAEGDDAMAAPDALPETGLNLSAGAATAPAVMVVLMLLVAGAFVTRRRPV